MDNSTEYQIYIGCNDVHLHVEVVSLDELIEMVTQFFSRKEIDFSILSTRGGFLHQDGRFDLENTMCVNIIGDPDLDIISLAKSLSMYMNQDCSLIVKNDLRMKLV